MQNRAVFIGKLEKPKGDKRFVTTSKKNENTLIMDATVVSGNNREFVKMFGTKTDNIKVILGKGESFEIPWENRFDQDVLDDIPYYKKIKVDIGEKKEFLSPYDAIKYLEEHYDEYKDKKLVVRCQISKNPYKGQISENFQVQGISLADEEEKPRMRTDLEFFWNKDCVDDSDWDKDKKLYVDGYIQDWDRESRSTKYFPHQIILNCEKVNFDDEVQKKAAEYRVKRLKIKDKTFQKDWIECSYIRGAQEQTDFGYDDLTDQQKEMVDIGMKTPEDFKPAGAIFGDYVTEYRVINFPTRGDMYQDGRVDTGLTEDEFFEDVYHEPEEKSFDDVAKDVLEEPEDVKELEDLFE